MAQLFTPLKLRDLVFRNRIFVSPMCQYSCKDGLATPWHLVHLGSRAVGGAALVTVEATGVSPEGRISPQDMGLWSSAHAEALRPIAAFVREQGAAPGIQLAHAGRKASTEAPWDGGRGVAPEAGGWQSIAPSALRFYETYPLPREMTREDIERVTAEFASAAHYALDAGFEVVELHMAHGYLLHSFLSPLTNHRQDDYGGSWENRARLPLAVTRALREAWPASRPVFVRISATDWVEGGWDLSQSVRLARAFRELGVDLVDCSSGGAVTQAKIPLAPGFQVPFAEVIRREAGIATGAVGLITDPHQAETILVKGQADAVSLARGMLRDPYWPLHAAQALDVDVPWPRQYDRARPPRPARPTS
jgi:2,4-dienoyl-CoA reductase-like NADH-dependent reductase (Old Yellow Enzyme family)